MTDTFTVLCYFVQTRTSVEAKLKHMLARKEQGTLEESMLRQPAYRNQEPLFIHDTALRQVFIYQ